MTLYKINILNENDVLEISGYPGEGRAKKYWTNIYRVPAYDGQQVGNVTKIKMDLQTSGPLSTDLELKEFWKPPYAGFEYLFSVMSVGDADKTCSASNYSVIISANLCVCVSSLNNDHIDFL